MIGGQIIPPAQRTTMRNRFYPNLLLLFFMAGFLLACSPPKVRQGEIQVSVGADGNTITVELPSGSTVQDALDKSGLSLGTLDRSDPPPYTLLRNGSVVTITRIREEFEVEQVVIPFERQVLRNESLPEGETRLSQPGANGLQEITYRRVFEDDVLISESIVRSVIVTESIAEIVMVGSQTPFAAISIPGRLAYLSAGNAWIMEGNTGNRQPLVATGDLDGRVFTLSPDGKWLLFSRNNQSDKSINTLWIARVADGTEQILDLQIENVIHFAKFNPASNRIAYSTVEPRSTAPGWQANNDLNLLAISPGGFVAKPVSILDANAGGVYGWWGTDFAWSPDGLNLAFIQPDRVGVIDLENKIQKSVLDLLPLQTRRDWAWVPGVAWSPDASILYTVAHVAPEGSLSPEESPQFDLVGIPLAGGDPITLVPEVGMFAYPVASPVLTSTLGAAGEIPFKIAYLEAIYPLQSETSRYRLMISDRDGSNPMIIIPQEGMQGLEPQKIVWSPVSMTDEGNHAIAFIYQDNIWLVDLSDGTAVQITGDGLNIRLDWR